MPDSTHHDGDDGFHEIQLSGKQLVFLFMATTVVAVVIFLCGVQVGRNVRSDRTADAVDAMAAASGTAAPAPQAPPASTTPASEPPLPAKDADEDLSYAKRLQSTNAPKEQLKPPGQGQTAPKPSVPQPAPATTTPQTSAAASVPSPPPQPAPRPVESAAGSPRPGNWVVQVQALKDRSAAEGIARGLIAKGYPAFVLDPDPGAPTIYRVQVGRYVDRKDAEQVSHKLETSEHYKPIIHGAR